MKHTAHKLLALVMVLAMLMSVFAVAENYAQDIIGADGPIELGGETVDETRDPAGDMEIAPEGDGLLDGIEAPADDLDLGLDGNLAIDLEDGLDGAAVESLEGELAPETEVAMNAGEGGTSESDAIEIGSWEALVAAMTNEGSKRAGESANNPTFFKLTDNVTCPSGGSAITVEDKRHIVLDLNGKKNDRGLSSLTSSGYVMEVSGDLTINDSVGGGEITGGNNSDSGHGSGGGGVRVSTDSGKFTLNGGTITGNTAVQGGGVCVGGSSTKTTFTMNGGTITGNEAVRWYSSDANVATVDANGKVKAVAKGSCAIYAVANNGVRASVKVKVK